MANDANRLLGQNGTVELDSNDGAQTFTGPNPVIAIQAINGAAATFTTLTDSSQSGTQRLTSLAANQIIYGKFSAITVATGAVRCYK